LKEGGEMALDPDSQTAYDGGADLITFIPEIEKGSTRILDFGCGNGDTLARLREEGACRELYGIEIREEHEKQLKETLDGSWIMDLGEDAIDLDEEYKDFFNYILLLDVVEHLYDPWYVLPKLAKFLSPEGKMIISVPNLRHWALWFNIVIGQFPYGHSGGLMNEEHIRWFTFESLKELIVLSGMQLESARLTFPPNVDVEKMKERIKSPIPELVIPPPETTSEGQKTVIRFPNINNISNHYPYFLANKIIVVSRRGPILVTPEHISVGVLQERRQQLSR
jgi:SAM-dependent methyltransferase